MSDMFYRVFEDQHRGSIELIKSRLAVYLPFIEPLKKIHDHPKTLDLGCGRGEWLELLQDNGFHSNGVDLDDGMLEACKARNLKATHSDAILYLKSLESESLSVISAFHLVEHIPFDALRQLVSESHRVLKPGGLLILETPNSENLLVGTSTFYMDPTHQRPIPAALLSFIAEYAEFARVKILYLQEPSELSSAKHIRLQDVFEGPSYDYAIVSQKRADASIFSLFDNPFNRQYGVRLLTLASRYESENEDYKKDIFDKWVTTQKKVAQLAQVTNDIEATLSKEQNKLEMLSSEFQKQLETSAPAIKELAKAIQKKESSFLNSSATLLLEKQKMEKISAELNIANTHNLELQSHMIQSQLKSNNIDKEDKISHSALTNAETLYLIERQKTDKLSLELKLLQSHHEQLQAHAEELQHEMNISLNELKQQSHYWWTSVDRQKHILEAITASWSWKITKPLRLLNASIKKAIPAAIRLPSRFMQTIKSLLKKILKKIVNIVISYPRIKKVLLILLNTQPHLKKRIQNITLNNEDNNVNLVTSENADSEANDYIKSSSLHTLSPRAMRVYAALRAFNEIKE